MKKAIERAVYYLDKDDWLSTPVKSFEYTDEESFRNIISNLHTNIEIIATFGQKDQLCYKIFEKISDLYTDLLLDKTTSVYIINRKDVAIKLSRCEDEQIQKRIAVIKLDSVLSEYSNSNNRYFLYPVSFILGGLTVFSFFWFRKFE